MIEKIISVNLFDDYITPTGSCITEESETEIGNYVQAIEDIFTNPHVLYHGFELYGRKGYARYLINNQTAYLDVIKSVSTRQNNKRLTQENKQMITETLGEELLSYYNEFYTPKIHTPLRGKTLDIQLQIELFPAKTAYYIHNNSVYKLVAIHELPKNRKLICGGREVHRQQRSKNDALIADLNPRTH